MYKRVLVLDPGKSAAGAMVLEYERQANLLEPVENFPRWKAIHAETFRPKANKKRKDLRVAQAEMEVVAELVRGVKGLINLFKVQFMAIELPDAGGQRYSTTRAISIASTWPVALVESLSLAAEYYTPREGKEAATGDPEASKTAMMKAMSKKYPVLRRLKLKADLEHAADAAGIFEAARNGPMIRTIERMTG